MRLRHIRTRRRCDLGSGDLPAGQVMGTEFVSRGKSVAYQRGVTVLRPRALDSQYVVVLAAVPVHTRARNGVLDKERHPPARIAARPSMRS